MEDTNNEYPKDELFKYRSFNGAMQNVLDVEKYREEDIKMVMLVLTFAAGFILAMIWFVNIGKIVIYVRS